MKFLLLFLLLASIAGAEVFHALSSGDAPDGGMCTAEEGKTDALRDKLLGHLRNH